jgi:hypothetical protein
MTYVPRNTEYKIVNDVFSSLYSSFKKRVKVSKHCENCGISQDSTQHYYIGTPPDVLTLRVDKNPEDTGELKINPQMILDDITVMESKPQMRFNRENGNCQVCGRENPRSKGRFSAYERIRI